MRQPSNVRNQSPQNESRLVKRLPLRFQSPYRRLQFSQTALGNRTARFQPLVLLFHNPLHVLQRIKDLIVSFLNRVPEYHRPFNSVQFLFQLIDVVEDRLNPGVGDQL